MDPSPRWDHAQAAPGPAFAVEPRSRRSGERGDRASLRRRVMTLAPGCVAPVDDTARFRSYVERASEPRVPDRRGLDAALRRPVPVALGTPRRWATRASGPWHLPRPV